MITYMALSVFSALTDCETERQGISSWFWVSPLLHYDLSCRYHFKELIPSLFGYNICHAGSLLENKCFSVLDHYLLYP